jgi:hypothetical protein
LLDNTICRLDSEASPLNAGCQKQAVWIRERLDLGNRVHFVRLFIARRCLNIGPSLDYMTMRYIRYCLVFIIPAVAGGLPRMANADDGAALEFASQRKVGQVDRASVLLEANGEALVKSGSGGANPERLDVSLTCRRDYEEKTLQLPTEADKSLRGVRFYNQAMAKVKKGTIEKSPALRKANCLVGVEIVGPKVTPYSLAGPVNMDELELMTAIGETLSLDQLLPGKPVKVGEMWRVGNDTLALLLALDEITSNSVQMVLNDVTPEYGRFELAGQVEGKLYGTSNQINLKAKCRFDRKTGRIDWFAMRVKLNREIGLVEDGLDVTVLVQAKIAPVEASEKLNDAALAGLPLKPTDALTSIQYQLSSGKCQVTHDRSWFLIDYFTDQDVFHRLDHGQDIGLCKISPQPQVGVTNLPTAEQFQTTVQKALGANFGEFQETGESQTSAHLRIIRVSVKGTDNQIPVRWTYYHVSDPEGRQAMLVFRVEEKWLETFGRADEALGQSVRFLEKVEQKDKDKDKDQPKN